MLDRLAFRSIKVEKVRRKAWRPERAKTKRKTRGRSHPRDIRAKALGRSLRIGTNHGSLSDRIMNRYGDTPLGMVESAMEFLRIGERHGFKQMILSMKSSNPKVMIEAYRLLVARLEEGHA